MPDFGGSAQEKTGSLFPSSARVPGAIGKTRVEANLFRARPSFPQIGATPARSPSCQRRRQRLSGRSVMPLLLAAEARGAPSLIRQPQAVAREQGR